MNPLNRAILAGRLVAAPEVRYTQNEEAVCLFRLAIRRGEETDFIDCVAHGGLAKVCGEYLKKGKLVAVEGRLQIKTYTDKRGYKKSHTEILVENMQMLDPKFYQSREEAKD